MKADLECTPYMRVQVFGGKFHCKKKNAAKLPQTEHWLVDNGHGNLHHIYVWSAHISNGENRSSNSSFSGHGLYTEQYSFPTICTW